ncbi:hypothetical protein PINS_up000071 [Pythium insidiosum]|nr:hypothetical protein PINS_up000071 [Pythium insidiosum]
MPDSLQLRRKRSSIESFWLRAIRGENNDKTNSSRGATTHSRESSSHRFAPWSWFSSTSSVASNKSDVSSQLPPDSCASDQTATLARVEPQISSSSTADPNADAAAESVSDVPNPPISVSVRLLRQQFDVRPEPPRSHRRALPPRSTRQRTCSTDENPIHANPQEEQHPIVVIAPPRSTGRRAPPIVVAAAPPKSNSPAKRAPMKPPTSPINAAPRSNASPFKAPPKSNSAPPKSNRGPPKSSSGPPKSNSRYVQRIAGPTLGSVLMRIHQNDGDVTELDFSYLTRKNKRFLASGGELVARVLMTNRTVKRLVLREHAIGDQGAIAIAELLRHNSTLEYIDLYSNDITDVGAEALAAALYGHESLVHLSLWSNLISNRGAAAFANALRHNRRLQYLGLVHNRITNDGAQALLDALSINVTLETLNLATNRVSATITSQIRVALAKNRVEAPRLMKQMTADEEDVERRLSSLRSSLIWEDVDAIHEDTAGYEDDDDEDASSDCSGFLSANDNGSDDEHDVADDSADESLWI